MAANLKDSAAEIASKGRFGDSELLHVNSIELEMLERMSPGGLTVNPDTGQKEAFLPFLIPLLSSAIAPSLAGTLGIGSGLATGLLSGLGTWAATGDAEQGLLSGLLGGLGGNLLGGAGRAGGEAAAQAAGEAVKGAGLAGGLAGTAAQAAPGAASALKEVALGGATNPLGGVFDWVRKNPMKSALGAAALPMLFGGASGEEAAPQEGNSPPYQEMNPAQRNIIPYGQSAAGPSTYVAGDDSQNDSIYRYGQFGGEHQFFDPVPNTTGPVPVTPEAPQPGQRYIDVAGRRIPLTGDFTGLMSMYRATGGPVYGPGNGQSDSIPMVGPGGSNYQLSDGEYIIPADVVSALGAGSNKAGATELSDMMHRVRMEAYGNANQPQPVSKKALPA